LRCKPATSKSGELSIAGVFSALPDYATATLLGKEIGRVLRFFTSVCVTSRTMESNHEDRSISTLCNLPRVNYLLSYEREIVGRQRNFDIRSSKYPLSMQPSGLALRYDISYPTHPYILMYFQYL